MNEVVYYGSQVVLNLHIDPVDGVSSKEYDFGVIVSAKREVQLAKSNLVEVDDDNYIILLDTTDVGLGEIVIKVDAYLPDGRWPNGTRRELTKIDTGLNIVKA